MIVDVLRSQQSGHRLLGRCDIPALSSDTVEVMDIQASRHWSAGWGFDWPLSHRFRVVRSAGGDSQALIPVDGANPAVLPGWTPADGG